jgi:hypothetical protein
MKTLPDDPNGDGIEDTTSPPADYSNTEPEGDEMGGMAENELCVDLQALAMPDEGDQMQPPAVGDKVQANVEGTVSRITGDKAYVTMSAVNGQKVAEAAPAPGDEEANLQQMAASQPDRY